MNKYFLRILLAAGFLFVGLGTSYAFAQSSAGFKITPAIIEDRADPGQTFSFDLEVTNIADEGKTFYLAKQNITGLDDGGRPIFSAEGEETPYEISSWIAITEDVITLGAGESKTVPFSVKVPEDASPGNHFGGIFFDFQPPKLRETGSGVGYKVGSIISLRISGDVIEEAFIREFSVDKQIYNLPNVKFKVKVDNVGNTFVRPRGMIGLTDMFGKEVSKIMINDQGSPIFPKGQRAFDASWEGDGLRFGRYQAVLSLVYGEDGRKTISRTLSFWVLPIKPIAIALGSLLAIIVFASLLVRYYIRKRLGEMQTARGKDGAARAADALYYKKYGAVPSRLAIVAVSLLVFIIISLVILFFLFA